VVYLIVNVLIFCNCYEKYYLNFTQVRTCKLATAKYYKMQLRKGLEPPFLHSGLSLMALYQNPEFQEDQRNFFLLERKILSFL